MLAQLAFWMVSLSQAGPGSEALLRWKIEPQAPLAYQLYQTDDAGLTALDISGLASGQDPSAETMRSITTPKLPQAPDLYVLLRGEAPHRIAATFVVHSSGVPKDAKMREAAAALDGTVQLRAQLDDAGALQSFYLSDRERNLLHQLLSLPKQTIHVKDSWPLDDEHLLTLNGPFIVDRAAQQNRVECVGLAQDADGEWVATLDYVVAAEVHGMPPNAKKGEKPFTMGMAFVARGEFWVNKGRWKSLMGRIHYRNNFVGDQDQRALIVLMPLSPVPPDLKNVK